MGQLRNYLLARYQAPGPNPARSWGVLDRAVKDQFKFPANSLSSLKSASAAASLAINYPFCFQLSSLDHAF
jgi:hypothetical protein